MKPAAVIAVGELVDLAGQPSGAVSQVSIRSVATSSSHMATLGPSKYLRDHQPADLSPADCLTRLVRTFSQTRR
jgi:hypothetical protein